jgi:hypothetical protein
VQPSVKSQKPGEILNDIPEKILKAKLNPKGEVVCLIRWKADENGLAPEESLVSNHQLKYTYPSLLIDFYESRLRPLQK